MSFLPHSRHEAGVSFAKVMPASCLVVSHFFLAYDRPISVLQHHFSDSFTCGLFSFDEFSSVFPFQSKPNEWSRYLTRGMGEMCGADIDVSYPWPSCSTHYALAMYQDEFYSWVWESLYDPHGPIHVWIGGVLDCGGTFSKIADLVGDVLAEKMALLAFVYRKNAFRSGYFKCEGTAQIDEASADVSQLDRLLFA